MPDPTQRFSDRVANYVRYRPAYPAAFYDFLFTGLLKPGDAVADIGSGTGISSRPLLERGAVVFAVEPNGPMRGAAEALLGEHAGFRSRAATAEETGLPDASVDVVLAAQAFHWFDRGRARAEFGRILKPGGHVVLVWNERQTDSTPFLREYEALLLRFATDYAKVRHENVDAEAISAFFAPGSFETRTFANEQRFDYAGLEGRLLSCSYAPAAGQANHQEMLAELRGIFERHQEGGRVVMAYRTTAYVGRLV